MRLGEPAEPPKSAGGAANGKRYKDAVALAKSGQFDLIDADILLRCFATLHAIYDEAVWADARTGVHQPDLVLREWQSDLLLCLESPPHSRHIIFVHDPRGNSGKSTFCRWFLTHPDWTNRCQILHPSRGVDMAYLLKPKLVFLLDCPRASGDFIPWATIEAIKNGHVVSTKYQCQEKIFPIPHVIVFCNSMPAENVLSADRIFEISC